MKGWLDKYGKEINANEGHSSAPKEWIGEGYSNVGRDYSPAWGGQFQNGGKTKSKYWTEKDFEYDVWDKFIKEHPGAIGMDPNNLDENGYHMPIYPSKPEPSLKKKVTKMEPKSSSSKSTTPQLRTIEQPNVELPAVQRGKYRTSYYDPEMKDWNERAFMSQQESDQFANEMSQRGYPGSYGNVTQRVQYAMGGSLPGSVGFTYARTAGSAPSNGPYAKKTLPSAQDGKVIGGKEFIDQWIQSPMYDEMLRSSASGKEYKAIKQGRENNFSQAVNVQQVSPYSLGKGIAQMSESRENMPSNEEFEKAKGDKDAILALQQKMLYPKVTGYNLSISKDVDENNPFYQQIMAHEFGHREDHPWDFKNWTNKEALDKNKQILYTPKSDIELIKNSISFSKDTPKEWQDYINQIGYGEVRGIINEGRYLGKANKVYDPYTEKISEEQFDNLLNTKSEDNPAQRLLRITGGDKKKAILLMNSISKSDSKEATSIAQNGMSYYQNGLDWKPKSISRDGTNIPMAQTGFELVTGIKPITSLTNSKESTSLGTKIDEAAIRQAQISRARENQGSIRKAAPERSATSKAWAIATHPMTALSYKAKGQDIPENFERGELNPYETAVNIVNPFGVADAAASIPGNVARGEFLQAGLNAASVIPSLGELRGLKAPIVRSMESGVLSNAHKLNPYAFKPSRSAFYNTEHTALDNITDQYGKILGKTEGQQLSYYKGAPKDQGGNYMVEHFPYKDEMEQVPFSYSKNENYWNDLKVQPSTEEEMSSKFNVLANIGNDNTAIYKKDWLRGWKNMNPDKTTGFKNIQKSVLPDLSAITSYPKELYLSSKDAGKLTLPKYKDIYRLEPTSFAKDADELSGRWFTDQPSELSFYVGNKEKNPMIGSRILKQRVPERVWRQNFGENMPLAAKQKSIGFGNFESAENLINSKTLSPEATNSLMHGADAGPEVWKELAENPLIYNKTEGIMPDLNAFKLRGLQSNKLFSPYTRLEGTNEMMPDIINDVMQEHWKSKKFGIPKQYVPFKEGGVIKDDMGQWAHPGEITEISGDTMATHGYGDISLYVVPDKGKPRLVKPNTGIQKFPGAKNFTEFPMAKSGIRQEQKGLQNLEDLTNFTNYNKPSNWLNKYN